MISANVVTGAATQASSQVTNPVGLALVGVVFLLFGLGMLLRPRQMSRPARWEYKNAERPEPSDFVVDVVRIFGFLWAAGGIVTIIAALVV